MPIHRLLALVLTPLAVLLCAGTVHAQRSKRVAIVVTVQVNVSGDETNALASLMGTAIVEEFGVDVIAGAETVRRLPPDGVPDECIASSDCRNDLSRRLDADELLMLVVVRIGDELQIDSTWVHVSSGETASRPKISLAASDDRAQVMKEASPRLLPHMEKPTPAPAPAPAPIIVMPQSSEQATKSVIPTSTWIAGGVSIASLAAASIFAVSARQKYEALDADGCRDVVCSDARIASLRRHARTADILFGVSGAAAATAIVFYVMARPPAGQSEQAPATSVLRAGPGTFGLAVGGDF